MEEEKIKRSKMMSFLRVDKNLTNTEEGNRAIYVFNVLSFTLFIFYALTALPFLWFDAQNFAQILFFESLFFLICIWLNKHGHFLISKNTISIALISGVITLSGVLGSDGFAHILFFPVVISQFIIFNRHEIAFRNFYIIIAVAQFFIMEFSQINYFIDSPLTNQFVRILEIWLFAVSFIANGSAVYYFLQINSDYKVKIKNYWVETKGLNKELSNQSRQVKESLEKLSQLNKKLKENERQFRFISENSKDILALITKDCKIQYVSPSVRELLGFTQSELESTEIDKYIFEPDKNLKRQILKNGSGEIRLLGNNRHFKWFDIVIASVLENDFEGYQLSIRDITDKKKVELELQSNKSLIERIAETTPNFLYVFHHKEKRVNYLNRSIWEYLGYDMNTLFRMDENDFHLIHPDDQKLLEENYQILSTANEGKVISSEYRMKNAFGEWVWFESRDTVLEKTEDKTELILSLGEARDITELKENQNFLLRKQNELLSFVQAAPAAIAMVDIDMTYIAASRRWYEDYKLKHEDILGKTHYEVFPDLPEHWIKIHSDCLKGKSMKKEEDFFILADGSEMWLRWEIIPWYRNPDEIGGIIMLTEDITKRKKEAEELKQAKLEAERASEAKAQFLSTMSHEIRTPLNSVIGMSNLLLSEDPKPDQIENLRALTFGAQNLMALVNDILDFSKIEAGGIKFESTNFSLHQLLKNVCESFKVLAKDKDIQIMLEQESSLPEFVKGDPTRLSQILNNIVGNAIKFTHKGHVKIKAAVIADKNKNARIRFSIEDTGIGIPKDKQEIIFESFSQASSATTRKYGGTGLGLAITRKLVDLQMGNLQLDSEPGKGTTFHIDLDFEIVKKEKSEDKPDTEEISDLEGYHILLVEDNKMNQLVAGKFLGKWKASFDIAENGIEAVESVLKNRYDLILMDLHMPEMDGYEATQKIRAMENEKRNTPIIALSASTGPGAEEKMEQTGMNGFVAKPFNPKDLFNAIKRNAVLAK